MWRFRGFRESQSVDLDLRHIWSGVQKENLEDLCCLDICK